ncbi:cobalamin-binding protein [Parasphingopyxis lamellibrachiae]|uniref:Iron complex transport system substrate-binding protein n=1 Tax=Parasphingopyxis lamellibrachiae TaxID=680125 RepID=A0A3D9FGP7_9SPHN|nr:cobalamin-binding protein [Parasphingopyxis lamellibrachiae]RED16984.1 iron complex transport system substrate-binding protein [Parasphingopyxis lamellibrachiae]
MESRGADDLRIVSLLPSATEIAVALGLGDNLVGRSHECDFPAAVTALPVCTRTRLEKGLRSAEIDRRVQEIVTQGLSMYEVDAELLRSLKPDIILTQTACAVCAVTPDDLETALADWMGEPPELISTAPDTLDDVWNDISSVGAAAHCNVKAETVVRDLRGRLNTLVGKRTAGTHKPRIAAIEWFDPLMVAGNWIPELIRIADGKPLFAKPGEHSDFLDWDELVAADPDLLILMPCGYQIPQSLADIEAVAGDPRWERMRAVRESQVYIADGHHFFNRPGPRLVESAEIVAEIIAAWRGEAETGSQHWMRYSG